MKLKTVFFITILIVGVVYLINLSLEGKNEEFKPLELNVGDVFSEVKYPNQMYVVNYAIADITGDLEKDMIIIVAEKEDVESNLVKNVDILVYDNVSKKFLKTGVENFNGQNPKIFLNDFTGDKINEIFVVLDDEKNFKNIRIVTLKNESLKEIFGQKDNKGLTFNGEVIDGVKAYLKCPKIDKEFYLDLSDKKGEYIKLGKFDESGKLISKDKKITTSNFSMVQIVELENQCGIQTVQRICAFDTNEIIDEITVISKYENGKWKMKEVISLKNGNLKL